MWLLASDRRVSERLVETRAAAAAAARRPTLLCSSRSSLSWPEAVEAAEGEGGGAVEVIVPRVERREAGTLVDRGGQRAARFSSSRTRKRGGGGGVGGGGGRRRAELVV